MNKKVSWFKKSSAVLSTIGTGLFPIGKDRITYDVMVKAMENLVDKKGLGGRALDALVKNIQIRTDPTFVSPLPKGSILILNKNNRQYAHSQWFPIPSFDELCERNQAKARSKNKPGYGCKKWSENKYENGCENQPENGYELSDDWHASQQFFSKFSDHFQSVFMPFSYQMTPADAQSLASWMLNIMEQKKKDHDGTSPIGSVPMSLSSTQASPIHDIALSGSQPMASGSSYSPDEMSGQLTYGSPDERYVATHGIDTPSAYARGAYPRGEEDHGRSWNSGLHAEPEPSVAVELPLPAPVSPAEGGERPAAPNTPGTTKPPKLTFSVWVKPDAKGREQATGYLDIGSDKYPLVFNEFDRAFSKISKTPENADWYKAMNEGFEDVRMEERSSGERRTTSVLHDRADTYGHKAPAFCDRLTNLVWENGVPRKVLLFIGYDAYVAELKQEGKDRFKGVATKSA